MSEVWVYFETDGDSGWYAVAIFATQEDAEYHKKNVDSDYGQVRRMPVRRKVTGRL